MGHAAAVVVLGYYFKRKMPSALPREKSLALSRKSSLSSLGLKATQLDAISGYTEAGNDVAPLSRKNLSRIHDLWCIHEGRISDVAPIDLRPSSRLRLRGAGAWEDNPSQFSPQNVAHGPRDSTSSSPFRQLTGSPPIRSPLVRFATRGILSLLSPLGTNFHCDYEVPPQGTFLPDRGVLLRTFVEDPFGSVARTNWVEYSTVILVAGGSGVSFGLSVSVLGLERTCLEILGRTGKPFLNVFRLVVFRVL